MLRVTLGTILKTTHTIQFVKEQVMPQPQGPKDPLQPPPPGVPAVRKPFNPSDRPANEPLEDEEADRLIERLRRGEHLGKAAE
jgi:hypothetical protein